VSTEVFSIGADITAPNDLSPFGHFGFDEVAEFRAAIAAWNGALIKKLLGYVRILQGACQGTV
jgi:hypothetical protein